MKKSAAAIVVALALTLNACVDDSPTPIQTVTPAPQPGSTVGPSPTSTPTPPQEELSAQAEQAYRAFFNEWKRLQLAGGADEPTPVMTDTASGEYLEGVMSLLRDQKRDGVVVTGSMPTTRVSPSPGGDYEGIDPRLTLHVCEDHREIHSHDGTELRRGDLLEGTIYLNFIDDLPKIVGGVTRPTDECES